MVGSDIERRVLSPAVMVLALGVMVVDGGEVQDRRMSPLLPIHIATGVIAILAGAVAASARKGSNLHRRSGLVFTGAMAIMSALAVVLAFATPQASMATPRQASATVGLLTGYLVATGWLAGRRPVSTTAGWEIVACGAAAVITLVLLALGLQAAAGRTAAPYFVFAGFAASATLMDLKWLTRHNASTSRRLTRHLWRMSFALFFATSFFFIGQRKVMPHFLQASPALVALGFAPLAFMAAWLVRLRSQIPSLHSTAAAS